MEEVLLKKMQNIVGWLEDEGDGIFCPGGTISNLYSILLARYHFYPEVKTRGMGALPQLALFTSEHSHYSLKKSAAVLGLGTDNMVMVKCDERAWSVTWNPHKMMGVPLQCSAILVKKRGLLKECNELGAEYLFQKDKHYDVSYDTGDKSIQCGRHVDAFKFWLMWKAKGSEGFEAQINKCLENAEYLYDQLQRRTDFKLVFDSKLAPWIKARMMEKGSAMVGYQPLGGKVNFFRCVLSNPATQQEDIDFLLDQIVQLGQYL
ncbi:Glutamate decarboxylase 1 [Takifugu flavidus]|uniref:Glutamate decarboxylase 1 n=1 Tax=Takifugu flavidus TaxID=433684 RepID=A0A5C6P2A0_9TELE|nr:Glutamate decarboxylase 1 [Takifugu flavidus]